MTYKISCPFARTLQQQHLEMEAKWELIHFCSDSQLLLKFIKSKVQFIKSRVRGCQVIHAESRVRTKICSYSTLFQPALSSKSLSQRLKQSFMRNGTAVVTISLINARAPYFYFTTLLHFVKSSKLPALKFHLT